jgi:hypothetical protein
VWYSREIELPASDPSAIVTPRRKRANGGHLMERQRVAATSAKCRRHNAGAATVMWLIIMLALVIDALITLATSPLGL